MYRQSIAVLAACILGSVSASTWAQGTRAPSIASSDVLSQISMFNYREGKKSGLVFRGTPIAANAEGKGQVEYEDGNAQISVRLSELPEPATLGPYTTYVLWALTPDGRAANQGVIGSSEGGKGAVDTQYGASQFALIITAEPHFAVTAPSNMMALYNVGDDVKGDESKVTTLTERSDYSKLAPIASEKDTPSEVVQARYAVAIAAAAGAEKFAPTAYATATQKLGAAQAALTGKGSARKTAPGLAREAVVAGEDARRAAMIGSAEATADAERQAAAAAATEAATAVERERSAATAATAARSDLLKRLNAALPTRESDRGLISEIGGVQFATGTADLNGSAREGLSRFSGIVASYPGLRFNVEGHTDDTGTVAANKELSLKRAISVRDYLIAQGIAASSIDVAGLGSSTPIADNSVADGRARNRRVEIVLSRGPLGANAR
jgi:outer membrane protein OmpA-like peptidoglycan-associated protein